MKASLGSIEVAVGAVALGVLAFVLYRSGSRAVAAVSDAVASVGDAVVTVGTAVNPLNHDNVIAATVNKAGAAVSGDSSFSLGSWFYNVTHPDENITAPTPSKWGSNYDESARLLARYPAPQPVNTGSVSGDW